MPNAVAIHTDMPVYWRPEGVPVGANSTLLLRVIALLEAAPPHFDEDDSEEAMRWQAMEARLDLCIQLVGQLLVQHAPLPQPCPVNITSEEVTWCNPAELAPGSVGAIGLYVSPQVPQPLWLPARVIRCASAKQGWTITAQYVGMDEELQDWLDKTIFRRHRREISERKRHAYD